MYLHWTSPPIKYHETGSATISGLRAHLGVGLQNTCSVVYLIAQLIWMGCGVWYLIECILVSRLSVCLSVCLSFQYKGPSSAFSTIPVPRSFICRVPSSVEGINHELENVFIRDDWEQRIQVGTCTHTHTNTHTHTPNTNRFVKSLCSKLC